MSGQAEGNGQTTMRLDKIWIGERHRKDVGSLTELADSIRALGLLQPLVVRPDGQLIAGFRRLAALQILKWEVAPVHVVDLDDLLRAERDENMCRLDFTRSEAAS